MKASTYILAILLAVLLMVLGSCKDEVKKPETTPLLIGKGVLSGGIEEYSQKNLVITTQSEWGNLKTKILERFQTLNSTPYIGDTSTLSDQKIDFGMYQIVAVFGAVHEFSGWKIEISDIIETGQDIVVSVRNTIGYPSYGETQPYCIYRIPHSDKSVRFQDVSRCEIPKSASPEIWECRPDPNITITLNLDTAQSKMHVYTCPQNLGFDNGYLFNNDSSYFVRADTLFRRDPDVHVSERNSGFYKTILSNDSIRLENFGIILDVPITVKSYVFTRKNN